MAGAAIIHYRYKPQIKQKNIDGKDSAIILLIIQTKIITKNFITCLYSATGFGHISCPFSSKYTANQQNTLFKDSVND